MKENLEEVEERIQAACRRAGRKREEVTLIAVSKTKPRSIYFREAYDLGSPNHSAKIRYRRSGINMKCLPKDIEWHMIGHLQTNKVKYIVDKVKTDPFC